jgi:hypothetical protein
MPAPVGIDIEQLKKELKVRERAIRAASSFRSEGDEGRLDSAQQDIVQHMRQLLEGARKQSYSILSSCAQQRQDIELDMDESKCESIPGIVRQGIHRIQTNIKGTLIDLRLAERDSKYRRNGFIVANDLRREPEYPESNILHWALVIAAVAVESIANSYFFSKGSDLGLLGGALQALLISVANIGTALMAGVYVLRQLYHNSVSRIVAGGIGTSVYAALSLLFNLATAHYRAELELNPMKAIVNAVSRVMGDPFGIGNFDAWVLFVIGIMFATFALIKGLTSDDRFPGYGKFDRNYKAARSAYEGGKRSLLEAVNEEIDKRSSDLDQIVRHARRNAREYRTLITRSENAVKEYDREANVIEKTCNALLREYRDVFRSVRDGNVPAYFTVPFSYGDAAAPIELNLGEEKGHADRFDAMVATIDDIARGVQESLQDINRETLDTINDFFSEIEKEADLLKAEENADPDTVSAPATEPEETVPEIDEKSGKTK